MLHYNKFISYLLTVVVCTSLCAWGNEQDLVEFNTDILDASDKENLDLSKFSASGYIMPGSYMLNLQVNSRPIYDIDIDYIEYKDEHDKTNVAACLTEEHIALLGLKPEEHDRITWWKDGLCADLSQLAGVSVVGDLGKSSINISIPQALLEYNDSTWVSPSRWENGIPGIFIDYNTVYTDNGNAKNSLNNSGMLGANLGSWRFRGEYQGNSNSFSDFYFPRVYAYTAVPEIKSKLTIGEDYFNSNLFESWRFVGASLSSDERMLPPKLRGYAPEVTGIARTNAKVTITQQGRKVYETNVPAGPFRIQELSSTVKGQLDVKIEEQDGSVQTFTQNTATIPYLTRPGHIRYSFSLGKPSDFNHNHQGPLFNVGEFSWGISNQWSLYGGGLLSSGYQLVALGLGKDLSSYGTISTDVTQSRADIPEINDLTGKSWRLSYSKRFDDINSEVTFAGYKFSEKKFMTMNQYLTALKGGEGNGRSKELYSIIASKRFDNLNMSTNLSWNHRTYWDRSANDRLSLSLSNYMDIYNWKSISSSLTVSRNKYNGKNDDMVMLGFSVPLSNGNVSYSTNISRSINTHTTSFYSRFNDNDSYRLSVASNDLGDSKTIIDQGSGYYTHKGSLADISANIARVNNGNTSYGTTITGGLTATKEGVALHPGGSLGDTRFMVSTGGVSDVPIDTRLKSNFNGIAVIPSVNSYYLTGAKIDANRLPDNIDIVDSPISEAALTEGAIGFRRFNVLKGSKGFAIIMLDSGKPVPFGAAVKNSHDIDVGIVGDDGLAWLVGIKKDESYSVSWGNQVHCKIKAPEMSPENRMLLPCII